MRELTQPPTDPLIFAPNPLWDDVDDVFVPASNSGYWYMNGLGDYLRLDDQFKRVDGLSVTERLLQLENSLRSHDRLYRDNAQLKVLALWVGLLFLPILMIVIVIWRWVSKTSSPNWSSTLLLVAALQIIVFILTYDAIRHALEVF